MAVLCVCACMCCTVRVLQRGTTSEFTSPEPRPVPCMALIVRFEASEQYQNNSSHAIGSPAEPKVKLTDVDHCEVSSYPWDHLLQAKVNAATTKAAEAITAAGLASACRSAAVLAVLGSA